MRRELIALALGAAVLYTVALGARDLWNPNEPTYGRAVAEMAERGDWLVPTVNGQVFGEKPILYFWMARSAALIGGIREATLRAPSALAGVACVALVYLLVVPYAGRRRARLAAALLATTYIVFWSARSIQMDLLLGACTLAALLAATRVVDHGLRPVVGWALAGAAAGLGFLAKGPVGLICPGLPLLLYLATTGRLRRLLDPALAAGGVTFAVVALPWYGLLWARGETAFLVELLYRQNVLRFIEPWDHAAPWWYFLEHFWFDMAPWGFFVPLAWGLAPADERERRVHRLAWLWLVALVVFFSLSASKRSPYILPVAPAVAILVSGVAARWRDGALDRRRLAVSLALVVALGLLILGGAVYIGSAVVPELGDEPGLRRAAVGLTALLAAGAVAVAAGAGLRRRRGFGAAAALYAFIVALYLYAALVALPALDERKSHRPFCAEIRARVDPGRPLFGYRLWRWRASYSYYSDRSILSLESAAELRDYWARPEPVFLIVERGMIAEARAVIGDREPLAARAVGHNFVYLFGNR